MGSDPVGPGRPWGLRESYLFDRTVIAEIQRAAREGIYDIRGFGAKRRLPHFDDLLFLGASISRYPLEGYRETCGTDVVLGTRYAKTPIRFFYLFFFVRVFTGTFHAPAWRVIVNSPFFVETSNRSAIVHPPESAWKR